MTLEKPTSAEIKAAKLILAVASKKAPTKAKSKAKSKASVKLKGLPAFNKWAKDVKFSDSYEYSNAYLGGMAWVIDEGVPEVKES